MCRHWALCCAKCRAELTLKSMKYLISHELILYFFFWDKKSTQKKNCWCWVNLPSINRYISMNGVVTSKKSHGRDAIFPAHTSPFLLLLETVLFYDPFFSAAAFWCEKRESLLTKSNIFITSSILLIVLIPIDSSHRSLDSASWKHFRGQVKQWMSLEWQIRSQLHVRKFSLEQTQRVKISPHENEIHCDAVVEDFCNRWQDSIYRHVFAVCSEHRKCIKGRWQQRGLLAKQYFNSLDIQYISINEILEFYAHSRSLLLLLLLSSVIGGWKWNLWKLPSI